MGSCLIISANCFASSFITGFSSDIGCSGVSANTISSKIAKDVFEIIWSEGGDPAEIVEKRGMKQVTDTGAIEKAVDAIIAANPEKVEQAKEKPSMLGWFVGQVMKQTGGKAAPAAVNDMLKAKLGIE